MRRRSPLLVLASLAVVCLAAWTGIQRDPSLEARLEVVSIRRDSGQTIPTRVYLFKDGRPFRLSPVDAMLPLRVDMFYRERLWRRGGDRPKTLEITQDGESHFILLDGRGEYELPAGKYRIEAHRGLDLAPAEVEFSLSAGERRRVELRLEPVAGEGRGKWLSGDDHIHLTREPEDDDDLPPMARRRGPVGRQLPPAPAADRRRDAVRVRTQGRGEGAGHLDPVGP